MQCKRARCHTAVTVVIRNPTPVGAIVTCFTRRPHTPRYLSRRAYRGRNTHANADL